VVLLEVGLDKGHKQIQRDRETERETERQRERNVHRGTAQQKSLRSRPGT
jgi:hypothetical protein